MESVFTGNRNEGSNPSLSVRARVTTHAPFLKMVTAEDMDCVQGGAATPPPRAQTPLGRVHELEFTLAWVALSPDDKSPASLACGALTNYCAGRLLEILDVRPEAFSAHGLATLHAAGLNRWCGGCAQPLDVLEARVELLRDLGRWLEADCQGLFANAITASKGRLGGSSGLLARLARTKAYANVRGDRVRRLFDALESMQVFKAVDPDALG